MSISAIANLYNKLKNITAKRPPVMNQDERQLDVLHPETGEWCKMINGRIVEYDDYASAVCAEGSEDQKAMLQHRNYMMRKDGLTNKVPATAFNPNVGMVTDLDAQQQTLDAIMKVHESNARSTDSPKFDR